MDFWFNMNEVILNTSGDLRGDGGCIADDALPLLAGHVVLGADVSLRSFVRMLSRYPDLQRLSGFAPQLAALSTHPAVDPAGLDRLEFSRVIEMIGVPEPPRLEVYHVLRGCVAGEEDLEIRSWQVASLLDLPLCLGSLRHVVFGDRVQTFRFETVCTLFDFIDGVVWQLAFHGAPQECALRR